MEGNGDAEAKEHRHHEASGPRSINLKIQNDDEHGQSPSLRQSGDDTASPGSVSDRERKDGSAGVGGLRSGGGKRIEQVQLVNRANADEDGSSGNSRWRSIRDRFRRAGASMTSAASGQAQPVSDPELASPGKNAGIGRSLSRSHSSSNPYPISDPELVHARGNTARNRISVSVRNSEPSAVSFPLASVPPPEEMPGGEDDPERRSSIGRKADFAEQAEQQEQGGARAVSLMALLEQSDSFVGSEKGEGEEEEEEEKVEVVDVGVEEVEADDDAEGAGDGMLYKCCVCLVRHKGAAFIPCGHTYCRLCSRELQVSRGNCPICTGFILEILDIL